MNECYADHPFSEVEQYQTWADQQRDLTTWHVAWDDQSGEMAGQVQVLLRKGLGELEEVSVRKPYRGRGLARALIMSGLLAVRALGV
ncbi:MAG: GNAT family N-acetyltransferase, partial [Chloroflexi bacterium]|nr:GNAT family N-acetyltransferase [Chloroflexota bacterium]